MASPFILVLALSESVCQYGNNRSEVIGWSIFWILFHIGWTSVFLVTTLRSFNRCLGRVEFGLPLWARYVAPPRKSPSMEEIAGEILWVEPGGGRS
jgi:hypothetical protein